MEESSSLGVFQFRCVKEAEKDLEKARKQKKKRLFLDFVVFECLFLVVVLLSFTLPLISILVQSQDNIIISYYAFLGVLLGLLTY